MSNSVNCAYNNNIIDLPWILYITRIQLAALHFNENAHREQAVTKAGEPRYDIVFPKYKKGGYIVKKVTNDPTYGKIVHVVWIETSMM